MRVFIVHAHHEPKSFNGAMTREAVAALEGAGHEVKVSDLYAMRFDPVSDRRNFTTVRDADYLKQQAEETYATEHDGFAPDIRAEIDKLFWCDALILQFPLWWFGLPAILKGWVDRVFALGTLYGGGRWYDRGVLKGRRAMCALTTGGPPPMFSEEGLNGALEKILYPVNHGMLAFTGFSVLEPFVVYAPARLDDAERARQLGLYRERVLALQTEATLSYPKVEEFDERYVRRVRSE